MKICFIASPSIHTTRWVRYFADNGHEVHLITTSRLFGDDLGKIQLHQLKRFGPRLRAINYLINTVPLMLQFRRLIRNIKPDILHAHSITDATWLGAASGFHPFVVTSWGSDVLISPQQSAMSQWLVKYVLKRADLITCDGENEQEALTQLGADPAKINLIYFGTDTGKFGPGQRDERLRQELSIVDSPSIISLRRLEPIYNLESLIQAVPLVLREIPQAKFLIANNGSQEAMLKQLAGSLGVSDSIKFVGHIQHDGLPRYLCLADIYVSTSLSDGGLGVSTFEAMACELPVVVTDVGDYRQWIKNGQHGFVIPVKAPSFLAEKIIYLLNHKDLREKMGKANRQLVEEKADYEKEMGKMANLYEEVIGVGK